MNSRPGESTLRRLLAPLAAALDDPETTEVCINRPDEFWVERRGVFERHDSPELGFYRLDAIATLAAAMTSQDIGPDRPLCATVLPGGQRVQICRPPAVDQGLVSITIRRPSAFVPTLDLLSRGGLFSKAAGHHETDHLAEIYASGSKSEFLAAAVKARRNILICGRTGSGKTTLGAAVARQIPTSERLITIEDTPEWTTLPH
jgi:type IV secretion system protein VirB11